MAVEEPHRTRATLLANSARPLPQFIGSGRKVKSRKQAIAIGLSEARRNGKKVPKKPHKRA
jgi:hypothetical protein